MAFGGTMAISTRCEMETKELDIFHWELMRVGERHGNNRQRRCIIPHAAKFFQHVNRDFSRGDIDMLAAALVCPRLNAHTTAPYSGQEWWRQPQETVALGCGCFQALRPRVSVSGSR